MKKWTEGQIESIDTLFDCISDILDTTEMTQQEFEECVAFVTTTLVKHTRSYWGFDVDGTRTIYTPRDYVGFGKWSAVDENGEDCVIDESTIFGDPI